MKTLIKTIAGAMFSLCLLAAARAGSYSAQANGTTTYVNQNWTIPAGATGQQAAGCYIGQVTNQGPFGYYFLQVGSPTLSVSGAIAPGNYNVILQLIPGEWPIPNSHPTQYQNGSSGYSVATASW